MTKSLQVISRKIPGMTETEKRRIVQESYSTSLSLNQFAKENGVSASTLCQWRKTFKRAGDCQELTLTPDSGGVTHFEQVLKENETLKTENQKLRAEMTTLYSFVGRKVFQIEAQAHA